ncbi:MAG: hypothetical protein NZM38_00710 [Cytophagales bacterium]|nr:hypothetical protein [Cytophagales bacterium]MDW8383268.1 hypothetical protein [Flammeovirgaceae bacterium]
MDAFIEITKIVLPSLIVLYGMFLVVKSFLEKYYETSLAKIRLETHEQTLSLRLQAYERMVIFLERIKPNHLITRLSDTDLDAIAFQSYLVMNIREEYNHNLSQQVYMSNEAWNLITVAYEEIISLINRSAEGLSSQNKAIDLAKNILDNYASAQHYPIETAILYLKNEVRELYQ